MAKIPLKIGWRHYCAWDHGEGGEGGKDRGGEEGWGVRVVGL